MTRLGLSRLVSLLALAAVISCASVERNSSSSATYSYRCASEDQLIVVTVDGDRGYLFSRLTSQVIQRQPGTAAFARDDVYYLPDQPADLAPGQTAEITINGKKRVNCKKQSARRSLGRGQVARCQLSCCRPGTAVVAGNRSR